MSVSLSILKIVYLYRVIVKNVLNVNGLEFLKSISLGMEICRKYGKQDVYYFH